MKYLLTFLLTTSLLFNSIISSTAQPDEECYTTAIHLMLQGNYIGAIENFEIVLASNPKHCEALDYISECYLALLLNAECKENALNFTYKTVKYTNISKQYFPEEGKPIYYGILARNQATLWDINYTGFNEAEYLIYEHFENYEAEMLGWYALGDYFLTCSYFPERQILKSYNSETISSDFFYTPIDCLIEDARYAFERTIDYYEDGVFGFYGLMEIALYKKDMSMMQKAYNAIQFRDGLHPLEKTVQYFATVLYDDCLLDDFYKEIDIKSNKDSSERNLLGILDEN